MLEIVKRLFGKPITVYHICYWNLETIKGSDCENCHRHEYYCGYIYPIYEETDCDCRQLRNRRLWLAYDPNVRQEQPKTDL